VTAGAAPRDHAIADAQLAAEEVARLAGAEGLDDADVLVAHHDRKLGLPPAEVGVGVGGAASGQLHP
jgi:hypothetical protein